METFRMFDYLNNGSSRPLEGLNRPSTKQYLGEVFQKSLNSFRGEVQKWIVYIKIRSISIF